MASALAVAAAGVSLPRPALAEAPPGAFKPPAVSPDEALNRLMEGNKRYVSMLRRERDNAAARALQVSAQFPFASVLSCSDSRVPTEMVFDQGLGDLFVVRVAGNVVDNDGLASIEYSSRFLAAPLIFVMGHTHCGAVDAAIKVEKEQQTLPGHLPALIQRIQPAVADAAKALRANGAGQDGKLDPQALLAASITENVRHSMRRLVTAQPIIAEGVAAGKLKVAGGVYDIADGTITLVS